MRRPSFIFIILSVYVLFQFMWWAYLLIALNDEVYSHRIETVALQPLTAEERQREIDFLEEKIDKRRWMVLGEGSVFVALLLWGAVLMIKAYRREILLAKQQRNFLLSVTHEFKSPLASIKLYMQTLLRHDLDKDKQRSFINSAINDSERLNTLVENALLANLIDHKGYSFSKEDFNFSAFIRLMTHKFQQMPEHHNLKATIADGLEIHADKNAMNILITNLLENAWKYSPHDKNIEVIVAGTNSHIALEIRDKGVGIPLKEKHKIFEKFYRIGNEETRKTKGTGLGLFICKYIIDQHDGKIKVSDNDPQGTIIRIEFPAIIHEESD